MNNFTAEPKEKYDDPRISAFDAAVKCAMEYNRYIGCSGEPILLDGDITIALTEEYYRIAVDYRSHGLPICVVVLPKSMTV